LTNIKNFVTIHSGSSQRRLSMDLKILTDGTTAEIIAGIIIGVLGFFFGHKRGRSPHGKKKLTPQNTVDLKDIKIL